MHERQSNPEVLDPATLVTREEAMRMFGIASTTWKRWLKAGRVPDGRWIPLARQAAGPDAKPGGTRRKVYVLAELQRALAQINALAEPYPDPDRAGCYRVPVMSFFTVRCEAIIDAEALPLISGKRWNWEPRSDGFMPAVIESRRRGKRKHSLRRVVLGLAPAEERHIRITHANGDPLDCRRCNLIVRDMSEQNAASRKRTTYARNPTSSRFKGVSYDQVRGRWIACIQREGKHKFLGRYRDETEAAQVYDQAARELFGEHARLNFPAQPDQSATAAPIRIEPQILPSPRQRAA